MKQASYDIIVVGGGHSGIEAALASARLKKSTLLITLDKTAIGQMSCNPAIGGLAKGHLVKELDVLGGEMAKAIDRSGIQFKMLNKSKGRAVWSPRAQADKKEYVRYMSGLVLTSPHLQVLEENVISLLINNGEVMGVKLQDGSTITSKKVIITSGTFLKGLIHIGNYQIESGRYAELSSVGLSDQLKEFGFSVERLKTGTPPRVTKNSIDFDKMTIQMGDKEPYPFSYSTKNFNPKNIACYLTHTNSISHEIIQENIGRSPLYSGKIHGVGPRYCPSIEDKIVRFSEKISHQLFLEPEWENASQWYVNGFSSSLPLDIQYKAIREVPGLERVEFIRPAYAIEYDYFPSHQIHPSLETKALASLYFAGQVNGTSGYEEAAVQGFLAGVNAARSIDGKDCIVLPRHRAYSGVLIDDLITKETTEPYRMFTSLAEYRLLLRFDNADQRLYDYSKEIGIVPETQLDHFFTVKNETQIIYKQFKKTRLQTNNSVGIKLEKSTTIDQAIKQQLIKENNLETLNHHLFPDYKYESIDQAYILSAYEGYIIRQEKMIEKMNRLENKVIPDTIQYEAIPSLSNEGREKLIRFNPLTIGQASRIRGISPADIQILLLYLK